MDALTGTQLDTAGSYFELVGYSFQPAVFTSKQISFLQIAYDPATGLTTYTFSASIPFNNAQTTLRTSAEVTSESTKALPDWFAPLLKAFVDIDKNVGVAGGKLTLTNGNFSGLKTVTVAGVTVLFTLDSKGSVNIPVPAGKVGTADLALTFDSGTMNIQDAIKYVAPIDVATVPVREISIAAGSAKITEVRFVRLHLQTCATTQFSALVMRLMDLLQPRLPLGQPPPGSVAWPTGPTLHFR
jgi:hypothetical protein